MKTVRLLVGITALSLAGPVVMPALADSSVAIADRPSGETDVVFEDGIGNLLFYWSNYWGAPWKNPPTVIDQYPRHISGVAMAVRSTGEIDVVAQGPNNSLMYYYSWDRIHWNTAMIAGPGTTFSSPAIAVSSAGEAWVVAQGPHNSLYAYTASPGTAWIPSMIAGTGTTFYAPAIAVRSTGEVDVAAQGNSYVIYYSHIPHICIIDCTPGINWTSTNILLSGGFGQAGTNGGPAIAVSDSGQVYVTNCAYYSTYLLLYWATPGSEWSGSIIDQDCFNSPVIAILPNGGAYIYEPGPFVTVWSVMALGYNNLDIQALNPCVNCPNNPSYVPPADWGTGAIAVRSSNPEGEEDVVVNAPSSELFYFWASPDSPWQEEVIGYY
jgi:hypothetical protein